MSTLQVRNVPEDVQRTLKARAAAAGQSLSEYVLAELSTIARRPTLAELAARIRHRGTVEPGAPAAEILRAERERSG
jgi:plasmid stability protein